MTFARARARQLAAFAASDAQLIADYEAARSHPTLSGYFAALRTAEKTAAERRRRANERYVAECNQVTATINKTGQKAH